MSMLESLAIVGFAIVILPPLLEKIHIDIRAGEVLTGAVVVAFLPSLVQYQWIDVLAQLGLLILMFEIGLDIDLDKVKDNLAGSLKYAALSFVAPFLVLFFTLLFFIEAPYVAMIIAIGLSSTALAVVSPLMRRRSLDSPLVKNAVMFTEAMGITLLVAFVHGQNPTSSSLVVQAFSILGFVAFTIFVVPRIADKIKLLNSKFVVNLETKLVIFLVVATALFSEQIGIHAATGAFMAGLFFSESTHRGLELEKRLSPIADLMVPIFFFQIGTLIAVDIITLNLLLFAAGIGLLTHLSRLAAFQSFGSILDLDYNTSEVNLFAPCITITATAAGIGMETGVLSDYLFTAFITSGLLLTILGPVLFRFFSGGRTG